MEANKKAKLERIINGTKVNYFRCETEKELKVKLEIMSISDMRELSNKVGVIHTADKNIMKTELLKAFKTYKGKVKQAESGNFGIDSLYSKETQQEIRKILKDGKR